MLEYIFYYNYVFFTLMSIDISILQAKILKSSISKKYPGAVKAAI